MKLLWNAHRTLLCCIYGNSRSHQGIRLAGMAYQNMNYVDQVTDNDTRFYCLIDKVHMWMCVVCADVQNAVN